MTESDIRPLVTAIIPYFNREATLPRALLSIDRQTYPAIEIVVVDDCSRAGLESTLNGVHLSRPIAIVRQTENKGPSAARNAGVKAAKGRFVAFLDSDDEWEANKIEAQVRDAMACADPDRVLCASRTRVYRGEEETQVADRWDQQKQTLAEFLFVSDGTLQTSSFFLSRRLAGQVPFAENLRQYEDNLFVLAVQAAGATIAYQDDARSIWHLDTGGDRLGGRVSLNYGFLFLDAARSILSRRERVAFIVRMLGPRLARERPVMFAAYAVKGLGYGVLTPRSLAGIVYRAYLKDQIRKLVGSAK
jgi:glycosyltransferase involved in cell wall biosynthesis